MRWTISSTPRADTGQTVRCRAGRALKSPFPDTLAIRIAVCGTLAAFAAGLSSAGAAAPFQFVVDGGHQVCEVHYDGDIPSADFVVMSDWVDVSALENPAAGDGRADDTAVLQAALDSLGEDMGAPRVVYIPAGRYRITSTLVSPTMQGAMIVGAGRDTVLEWDGPPGGIMFHSDGMSRSAMKHLAWDGKGRAAVAIDHRSSKVYETRVVHESMSFRRFTVAAIRVGEKQKVASAEMMFYDLLFEANAIGVQFKAWNDYNNLFDGCHFDHNDYGIHAEKGNVVVRNSRFRDSKESDLRLSTHSHSMRRVVSLGSNRFVETVKGPNAAGMLKIQDVMVEDWKNPSGAVVSSLRGPLLVINTLFKPSSTNKGPPIRLDNPPHMRQSVVIAGVVSQPERRFVEQGPNAQISIVDGPEGHLLSPAGHVFLDSTPIPAASHVINARRDCGAKGRGKTDDTVALRRCVERAQESGPGTVLYLPAGHYPVSAPISIENGTFTFAGTGWGSNIQWRGRPGGTVLDISNPRSLRLEHLRVTGPSRTITIRQTGTRAGRTYYDYVHADVLKPGDPGGVRFDDIPAGSVVTGKLLDSSLDIRGGASAYILPRLLTAHRLQVSGGEGAAHTATGITGAGMLVSCCADTQLTVTDGRNLVVSDWYSEQGASLFDIRRGDAASRVTLDFSKAESTSPAIGQITDYEGSLAIIGGMFGVARERRSRDVVITGPREPNVGFLGSMFWHLSPRDERGGLGFSGSIVQDKSRPLAVVSDRGGRDANVAIAGLTDLRRLGRLDLWTRYCQP